eukprot:180015_1
MTTSTTESKADRHIIKVSNNSHLTNNDNVEAPISRKGGKKFLWSRRLCIFIAFIIVSIASLLWIGNLNTKLQFLSNHSNISNRSYRTYETLIAQDRMDSEMLFRSGNAYLWFQHARKCGGTALCMTLRWNMYGLLQRGDLVRTPQKLKRKSCQLRGLFKSGKKPNQNFTNVLNGVMKQYQTNFIEFENSGLPTDILTNSYWKNWTFITSMRNPMDRIVSAIKRLPQFCNGLEVCDMSKYINANFIKQSCDHYMYTCINNYFIRMLLGFDGVIQRIDAINQTHLIKAKQVLHRISCVIIVESWDDTIKCLGERLGLYRTDNVMRNYGASDTNHTTFFNAPLYSSLNHSNANSV